MTPEERVAKMPLHWLANPETGTAVWGAAPDLNANGQEIIKAIREAVAQEREAIAAEIERQGRLLQAIHEDDRHQALISDLALMVRERT